MFGLFLTYSILAIKDEINFTLQVFLFSKASARGLLNEMASVSISASQRIFYGKRMENQPRLFLICMLAVILFL